MNPTLTAASATRHRPPRTRDGGPPHIRALLSEQIVQLSARELSALIPDEKLSELIYLRTTAQQLEDLRALKIAQEQNDRPTYADEVERVRRQADDATAEAFAALQEEPGRLANIAGLWLAMAVDDDLIGAWLIHELLGRGIERDRAERLIVQAGIDWTPRTDADRWRKVAEDMIREGSTPDQVREAIVAVRAREAVAA